MKIFLFGAAAAGAIAGCGPAFAQAAAPQRCPHRRDERRPSFAPMCRGMSQRMFARLDASKDGFVTRAEADAVARQIEAKADQGAGRFDPGKIFARLDANKDGKVTQAEADALTRLLRPSAASLRTRRRTDVGGCSRAATSTRTASITRAEFDAAATQMKARMEHAGVAEFGERTVCQADD